MKLYKNKNDVSSNDVLKVLGHIAHLVQESPRYQKAGFRFQGLHGNSVYKGFVNNVLYVSAIRSSDTGRYAIYVTDEIATWLESFPLLEDAPEELLCEEE